MVTTAFISMWITNTATTAMMTPIMEAVLKQLDLHFKKNEEDDDGAIDVVVGNQHSSIINSKSKLLNTTTKQCNDNVIFF